MAKQKQKRYHGCTIIRTMRIEFGSMSLTGDGYKAEGSRVETKPCDVPLFGDERALSGVCRACADGWEVEGNKFANDAEKARALAAPKTKGQ